MRYGKTETTTANTKRNAWLRNGVAAFGLGVLAAGCGSHQSPSASERPPVTAAPTTEPTTTTPPIPRPEHFVIDKVTKEGTTDVTVAVDGQTVDIYLTDTTVTPSVKVFGQTIFKGLKESGSFQADYNCQGGKLTPFNSPTAKFTTASEKIANILGMDNEHLCSASGYVNGGQLHSAMTTAMNSSDVAQS